MTATDLAEASDQELREHLKWSGLDPSVNGGYVQLTGGTWKSTEHQNKDRYADESQQEWASMVDQDINEMIKQLRASPLPKQQTKMELEPEKAIEMCLGLPPNRSGAAAPAKKAKPKGKKEKATGGSPPPKKKAKKRDPQGQSARRATRQQVAETQQPMSPGLP